MGIINVVVVEPDSLRRRGIIASIVRCPGIRIVGEGNDFVGVLKAAVSKPSVPNVLVINIDNPPLRTMKYWAIIRSVLPNIRIVGLTRGRDNRMFYTRWM